MPKSSAVNHGPLIAIIAAVCVLICSIALTITASQTLNVHGFREMNTMAKLEATTHKTPGGKPPNAPEVSPHKFVQTVLVLGIAGIIVSLLAVVGAHFAVPCLLITFFFFAVGAGIFFAIMAMSSAQFTDVVEPVIARQVDMYCNGTSYPMYAGALVDGPGACAPPAAPTQAPAATVAPAVARLLTAAVDPSCGEECTKRVEFLKQVGGCTFLTDTCGSYSYKEIVGEGFCALSFTSATQLTPATVQAPAYTNKVGTNTAAAAGPAMTDASCKDFCDAVNACSAYSYDAVGKECRLVTADIPVTGTWNFVASPTYPTGGSPLEVVSTRADLQNIVGVTGGAAVGTVCKYKTMPAHIDGMETAAATMAIVTAVSSFVFIICGVAACGYVFTVGTNKQGKKGAGAMFMKLMCPCCSAGDRQAKSNLVRNGDQSGTDYDIE